MVHPASRRLIRTLITLLGLTVLSGAQPLVADAAQTTSKQTTRRYSAAAARARRAKLARAREAARARELAEVAQPRFKLDSTGAMVPDIRAEAGIIYNPTTGEVLWEANSLDQRSLASITKTMTALVFLESEPDLDRIVQVTYPDVRAASTTYLRSKDKVRIGDLLHLLLVASDNAAARTLARVSPWGSRGFIDRMNQEADEMGLISTHFVDPSGLLSGNLSSAYDISKLIARAADDPGISSIMRTPEYSFRTGRRTVTVRSTNKLLDGSLDVRAGKTGFIRNAGYCFATLMQLPRGEQVAVVVLGAKSSTARFMEVRHLLNWISEAAQGWMATMQPEPQEP